MRSIAIVATIALWVVVFRLNTALGGAIDIRTATGYWHGPGTAGLVAWWAVIAVAAALTILLWAWLVRATADFVVHVVTAAAAGGAICWAVWGGLIVTFETPRGWSWHGYLGLAVAALIVASAVVIARGFDVGADRAWGVPAIRLNLLILALLFAAAFLIPMTSGQAIDIMRAWADEGARRPAFALAAALLLGEMMRESGLRLGGDAGHGPTTLRIFRGVTVVPTLVLFVGAVSAATDSGLLVRPWADRWVLGACLTAVGVGAVMALLVRTVIGRPPGGAMAWPFSDSRATFWAAAAAGVLAGMLLGLRPELPAIALIVLLLLYLEWQLRAGTIDQPIPGALPIPFAIGVSVGFAVLVYWDPIVTPRRAGAVAVMMLFLAGVLGALHYLIAWTSRYSWQIQGRTVHIPVLTCLVVLLVAGTQCAPQSRHQARTVPSAAAPMNVEAAVGEWLDQQEAQIRSSGGDPPAYLPMLLVGASGGGSKSAYWTDLVLDCIVSGGDDPPEDAQREECSDSGMSLAARTRRARALFMASGVSGGSIGIVHYVRHRGQVADGSRWVDDAAGREVLAPTVAWGLYHDLIATAIPFVGSNPEDCASGDDWSCRWNLDRAAVQENAIAGRHWNQAPDASQGVTAMWESALADPAVFPMPAPVFNMAVSGGIGRVAESPLDLAPMSVLDDQCRPVHATDDAGATGLLDAADLYAGAQDFSVTTAGLLSGRFPVVDPVARVGDSDRAVPARPPGQSGCLDQQVQTLPSVVVRDGGYVENTGLLTITQALPAIQRGIATWEATHDTPVVVWVLSIDDDPAQLNGVRNPTAHGPGPLSITQRANDMTLTTMTRDALALGENGVACYGRISPQPRIGAQAASGWELSVTVRLHDLVSSLNAEGQNYDRIRAVRTFLSGVLSDPTTCGL